MIQELSGDDENAMEVDGEEKKKKRKRRESEANEEALPSKV